MTATSPPALTLRAINVYYARLHVVQNASLELGKGECVSIVGRNSAGRSSLLHGIMGLVPRRGEITVNGERLPPADMRRAAAAGIGMVPEQRRLFPTMSVEENLALAILARSDMRTRLSPKRIDLSPAYELFPDLRTKREQLAGTLSGGQMQMVAIGRLIVADTRIFLLDSLSLGLSPVVAEAVYRAASLLKTDGRSILLVEDDAALSIRTELADRVLVMESGTITRQFSNVEARLNPGIVVSAYLA